MLALHKGICEHQGEESKDYSYVRASGYSAFKGAINQFSPMGKSFRDGKKEGKKRRQVE